jgi:hypothetical protein
MTLTDSYWMEETGPKGEDTAPKKRDYNGPAQKSTRGLFSPKSDDERDIVNRGSLMRVVCSAVAIQECIGAMLCIISRDILTLVVWWEPKQSRTSSVRPTLAGTFHEKTVGTEPLPRYRREKAAPSDGEKTHSAYREVTGLGALVGR